MNREQLKERLRPIVNTPLTDAERHDLAVPICKEWLIGEGKTDTLFDVWNEVMAELVQERDGK